MRKLNTKTHRAAGIVDLGNAVAQTKGSVLQGNPDTATGQKFPIGGLTND